MIYRGDVYMFLFALNLIDLSLSPFKGNEIYQFLDDLWPQQE